MKIQSQSDTKSKPNHHSRPSSLSGVDQAQFKVPVKHLKGHSLHELIHILALRKDNLESVAGLILVEDS